MKTREQVEYLKRDWNSDPCYDLEDVANEPEWAEHRDELLQFAKERHEAKERAAAVRQREYEAELDALADTWQIPGNRALAGHLKRLSDRLTELEDELYIMKNT